MPQNDSRQNIILAEKKFHERMKDLWIKQMAVLNQLHTRLTKTHIDRVRNYLKNL